ncbi:MAG: dipeptidase [Gemmatimonadetes bacterium]|nr:dipeptidase [Gemmatimonadota bacterium]
MSLARRRLLGLAALVGLATPAFFFVVPRVVGARMNRVDDTRAIAVSARAETLHKTLFVADLHNDLLLWDRDPVQPGWWGHTDVQRLVDGNVAFEVFSTVTKTPKGQNYLRNSAATDNITLLAITSRWPRRTWGSRLQRALYQADKLEHAAAISEGRLVVVHTARELQTALEFRERTPVIKPVIGILNTEGLQAIDGELANVDTLFAHGFRMAGLAHFFDNEVAGSAHGEAKGGLTPLGRQVLQRMEALGLIVDLAHVSPQGFDDALALSTKPLVVSHTGVQATCEGPRNLSDGQLRALAARGALIGIGFWDGAVCDASPRAIAKAIRHAVDVAGLEHVALGSDWDGATTVAFGADQVAQVTEALLQAGFSEDEIRAVMGENVRRFMLANLPPGTESR